MKTKTPIYPDLYKAYADSGRIKTKASKDTYAQHLRQLQAMYPDLVAERVTSEHLTNYCLSGSPSDNTIRARKSIVGPVFAWAEFKGITATNPASVLRFTAPSGHTPARLGNWLTEQQVAEVLRACPDTFIGRRQRLVLMFGFFLGVRADVIAKLRWDQFSGDLSRWSGRVKGNKPTVKDVPEQLRQELVRWRATEVPKGCNIVFPSVAVVGFGDQWLEIDWARPCGYGAIYDMVKQAGQRVGIETLAPHDMRRTLAGVLERQGKELKVIQHVLDHENIGTTNTYLEKDPNRRAAATADIRFEI